MIWLMAPDLPAISGGLRVIHALAAELTAVGHPARVWHGTPGLSYDSYTSPATVVTAPEITLEAGDVLVMPEVGGGKWSDLNPDVPTVMLVQGIDFVFADADFTRPAPYPYPGWPQAVAAVAVSEVIEEFLAQVVPDDFGVHRVPLQVDADLFTPTDKQRTIALMPRRRREDLLGVVQLLYRAGLAESGWSVELIDSMPAERVAEVLGRSAIFLHGGEREGFGLPGAEAMAAGCHVIGFTGHGGREFMLPEVAEAIDDSDVVAMAAAVRQAMTEFDTDPEAYQRRSAAAREVILRQYGAQAQRRALVTAFGALTAADSPALIPQTRQAVHFQTRAPRGQLHRAWIGARTVAGAIRHRGTGRPS